MNYRSKTPITPNQYIDNILTVPTDLRIRNIPQQYAQGALVGFTAVFEQALSIVGSGVATVGTSPIVQAFIGDDLVAEYAELALVVKATDGADVKPPFRRGYPAVPTDTLFKGEGAFPGDLIRISARATGASGDIIWLLDVTEVM